MMNINNIILINQYKTLSKENFDNNNIYGNHENDKFDEEKLQGEPIEDDMLKSISTTKFQ